MTTETVETVEQVRDWLREEAVAAGARVFEIEATDAYRDGLSTDGVDARSEHHWHQALSFAFTQAHDRLLVALEAERCPDCSLTSPHIHVSRWSYGCLKRQLDTWAPRAGGVDERSAASILGLPIVIEP